MGNLLSETLRKAGNGIFHMNGQKPNGLVQVTGFHSFQDSPVLLGVFTAQRHIVTELSLLAESYGALCDAFQREIS